MKFINEAGADEAGYGQGVTRAFMQQLVKTAFEPRRGLFKTAASQLYPNPHAHKIVSDARAHFLFLGRLLGKVSFFLVSFMQTLLDHFFTIKSCLIKKLP